MSICRCGHAKAMHEHLRDGSDCGRCGGKRCSRYRDAESGLLRLQRWISRIRAQR